mmetsp:Transcript_4534/g.5113  ORF Transcript_4534/g.5113 Transcript_4534/m.5113 type:complete len:274 (-) Transcript_4534:215-1036(-)
MDEIKDRQVHLKTTLPYRLDLVRSLVEGESTLNVHDDFLSMTQNDEIKAWMREKLVVWIIELSEELELGHKTSCLAVAYTDYYLSKEKVEKKNLQLIGIASLMIAIKNEECISYTLKHAVSHTSNLYTESEIRKAEVNILKSLNWRTNLPTSSDLIRNLLYLTNASYNFTKIIARTELFINVCLSEYSLCMYGPTLIGIVSTLCALEQFNQISFREKWFCFVSNLIDLDMEGLKSCKEALTHRVFQNPAQNTLHGATLAGKSAGGSKNQMDTS